MSVHRTVDGRPGVARVRVERWIAATLEGVCGDLASTGSGRSAALLRAAIRIGVLVGRGLVGRELATERLHAAALTCGYRHGQRTASGVIKRGLRYGAEHGQLPHEIEDLLRGGASQAPPETAWSRPPEYPQIGEVAALWDRSESVLASEDACAFLRRRGVDPIGVHDGELARALTAAADLPRWARGPEGAWTTTGHTLLVPLYDERAVMRSVLARDVTGSRSPKSLAPAGCSRRGLIMADPYARQLLRGTARPRVVAVCEGEIDYLAGSTRISDADEDAPAVLGVLSGSWTAAIAARIPDHIELVIATDSDESGEAYARQIVESFADRDVRLTRWRAA